MAAADSQRAAEASTDRSVLLNGSDEVGTARWLKPTAITEHPAEKTLIKAHHQDENQRRAGDQKSQELHRDVRNGLRKKGV